MMAEGLGTCAKAGWLCAARSRWRLTAGERSSLGTYLAYPFGPAAHIPTRPLNGQETAGGGCQNGRSSPDPPLRPLRDGGHPPCCCRGFRRALLGAAPPLDVRRPCWQPAPRPAGGNLRAAGPLAPGSELRMWELGAGCRGRAEQPDRGADREGGAEPPPSVARRAPPPTRPPPPGAAVPQSCGSRRSRQPAAAAETLPLSAGGGAAAVHGRRAPAGRPRRRRRPARWALCPARRPWVRARRSSPPAPPPPHRPTPPHF